MATIVRVDATPSPDGSTPLVIGTGVVTARIEGMRSDCGIGPGVEATAGIEPAYTDLQSAA